MTLKNALQTIRSSYARRTSPNGPLTSGINTCHDEIRAILLSQSYQRWDAPLRDIIHTLATHFSVKNAQTMSHDQSRLKRMFDMDKENVPEFLQTQLKIGKKMAVEWCDILWLDRMREMSQ